jgi:hypothetical protein
MAKDTSTGLANMPLPRLPPFSDLPLKKDGPPYNAWGLYGDDDELGRLNLITPEVVQKGRDAVKHGIVINLKYVRSRRRYKHLVPGTDA